MRDNAKLALAAMVCVTVLEIVNLATQGPDGTIAAAVVAVIAGLGGYFVRG